MKQQDSGSKIKNPEKILWVNSAAGGTRTHTVSLPPDFESGASASSATAANKLLDHITIKHGRMQAVFLIFADFCRLQDKESVSAWSERGRKHYSPKISGFG